MSEKIDDRPPASVKTAMAYHERTKHAPYRYARSLGYMDWDTQPDPFRTYNDVPKIPLPLVPAVGTPSYRKLLSDSIASAPPPNLQTIAQLFFDSLAISAWKEYEGARWALRCNPSSGNLHPTEGYLICDNVPGVGDAPGVFHYNVHQHALELRGEIPIGVMESMASVWPPGTVFVGLSTIVWRESWKYGERAFRYCHHDVGHAIGAVSTAAAVLGWSAILWDAWPDDSLDILLGTHRQTGMEAEHADSLIAVIPGRMNTPIPLAPIWTDETRDRLASRPLAGSPNVLSVDHHDWEIIDVAANATRRPDATSPPLATTPAPFRDLEAPDIDARHMIHTRRSAVDMDGQTHLSAQIFFQIVRRLLPGAHPASRAWPWPAQAHLAIFVHRIDDVAPGLYLLVRDENEQAALHSAMRPEYEWAPPPGTPPELARTFFRLRAADVRGVAAGLACGQHIAGDGAFSVAMIARFEPSLRNFGAWFYRRLHWECGMIGQILYLEAQAAGVRATGIGCFYDDSTHDHLGLRGTHCQTLYHFTVGGSVDDARLRTLAPYAHLDR